MWSDIWQRLIEAIHAKAQPTVLVVTGGGASAIAELLEVAGASQTVLEARVPYFQEALFEWLGHRPDHTCDEHTALAMASVACQRGRQLLAATAKAAAERQDDASLSLRVGNCAGLSCTASLASNRPKKGDHRFFAAVQTSNLTVSIRLILKKGARSRQDEEALTGQTLVRALAESLGIVPLPDLGLLPDEELQVERVIADPRLAAVWSGLSPLLWSLPDGTFAAQPVGPVRGLLCGAFDPLHRGHEILRQVAESRLGGSVGFELSITNVDKPPLDFLSIDVRRRQFRTHPLVLTNAPRFVTKAAVLPGMTFVIGSDTAERLLNARYDGGTQESLNRVLEQIQAAGCRFLVAYRVVRGHPLRLSDLSVPTQFQGLFEEIPESEFRVDLSSTELRRNADSHG
ncbi:MAG: hypothetical protein JWM11_7458 [Planctomycetaceae bacterium]|nr:hypothetical protein [Planctomycetaceae bacterium]